MKKHYYNDIDPNVCAWVKELINLGFIPDGDIDGRSIANIKPDDVRGYTQCHFFCGICGWPEALRIADVSPNTKLWTASCPCQPFSICGKGEGVNDPRHLWPYIKALAIECQPPILLGEQVASPDGREWLGNVRKDLESIGYAVSAVDLCAAAVGTPHIRQRLFLGAIHEKSGITEFSFVEPQSHYLRIGGGAGVSLQMEELADDHRGRVASVQGQQEEGFGSGMADAEGCRLPESGDRGGVRSQTDGESKGDIVGDGESSFGGLADTQLRRRQQCHAGERNIQLADENGDHGGLDDTIISGLEGHRRDVDDGHESRRIGTHTTGSTAEAGPTGGVVDANSSGSLPRQPADAANGHGSATEPAGPVHDGWGGEYVYCSDNTCRRIPKPQSRLFPLADGVRRGVGHGGDPRDALYINGTQEARVARLKAYGNSIVPAATAKFIKALFSAIQSIASNTTESVEL